MIGYLTVIRSYVPRDSLRSTEHKPNFELSSFPCAISIPVHDDTGKFQHSCKDT